MYKKNIFLVLLIVLLLGMFFQYNRSDGFVRRLKNNNIGITAKQFAAVTDGSDNFLLIYAKGNMRSLFLKHQIESLLHMQKKKVTTLPYTANINWGNNYTAVVVTFADIGLLGNMQPYEQYVQNGGSLCFAEAVNPAVSSIASKIGIAQAGSGVNSYGLKLNSDILLKGNGFEIKSPTYQMFVNNHQLLPTANVHIKSQENLPVLWEQSYGRGKFIVYNSNNLGAKTNRGVLTGMLALSKENYFYPIIGIKTIFIDDYPAPVPEGNYDKIYREFQLSPLTFFRQVWWPEMLRLASLHDVKYTGLIIESYKGDVKSPFEAENDEVIRHNFVVHGRELLKHGGELGINGYNHQPLVVSGSSDTWNSVEDMFSALTELKRYVNEFFPEYQIRVYVPPANILSPEGKAVIKQAFPDLKVFCSLYEGPKKTMAYYQDFARNPDGTFELPRVTSGFVIDDYMLWNGLNVMSTWGVFSHFVYPGEIFFIENRDYSWHYMRNSFESLLKSTKSNYPWLRATTTSGAIEYMADYFDISYSIVESKDELEITCENFRKEVFFILKTSRKIIGRQNCKIEPIDTKSYLVKISRANAKIIFEREPL